MTWKEVELAIASEEHWLMNNILPFQANINPLKKSDQIFYRAIAVMILSGKIKVNEYTFDVNNFINKLPALIT